ncbi:MAG: hypothetical protein C0461_03880 [Brevundimonas sp.]|nr:hypothetical protein [Brevundimonas sp.]
MLAHPYQITKSPAPSDPESKEGEAVTMETIQNLKGPGATQRFREKRSGDRFYGERGRGAGLYAEVRPLGEPQPLILEAADETR